MDLVTKVKGFRLSYDEKMAYDKVIDSLMVLTEIDGTLINGCEDWKLDYEDRIIDAVEMLNKIKNISEKWEGEK